MKKSAALHMARPASQIFAVRSCVSSTFGLLMSDCTFVTPLSLQAGLHCREQSKQSRRLGVVQRCQFIHNLDLVGCSCQHAHSASPTLRCMADSRAHADSRTAHHALMHVHACMTGHIERRGRTWTMCWLCKNARPLATSMAMCLPLQCQTAYVRIL